MTSFESAQTTLHDFVLNLLSDSSALSAFQDDAAGVLNQAGLGDISAVDVQEVVPLVVDTLPLQNVDVVDNALGALSSVDSLAGGQAGAIAQLQAVTAAFGQVGGAMGLETPLGDLGGTLTGSADGISASVAGPMSTSFALPTADVADLLDGHAMSTVSGLASGVPGVSGEAAALSAVGDNLMANTSNIVNTVATNPTAVVYETLSNPTGVGTDVLGAAESMTVGNLIAASSALPAGDTVGNLLGQTTYSVNAAVAEASSHVNPAAVTDLAGHVSDPSYAIGTAEGAVGTASSTVSSVTSHLPLAGDLPGVGAVTGSLGDPSHVLNTVTSTLSDPTHALGNVTDTVSGVTSSVPGVSSVTSSVTDSVSHSPLGAVTSTVSGALGAAGDTASHVDSSTTGHTDGGLLDGLHL
ncbi:MAG TPA: IniB N-terminal domain-containing protein [Pseudonocardiaceae bacterium]|jgi:hypothetical protein|nr:IniB N-terminal domain-containing protein [Pseudonocardiaceae bacterium]